jgi:pimeloyl-ACP methyl ester carboxylesterase
MGRRGWIAVGLATFALVAVGLAAGVAALVWLLDDSAYRTEAWAEENRAVAQPLDGAERRLTWHACPFMQPVETTAACATLTVPASRATPTDEVVDLAVVVLESTGEDPAPDPIVYLEGGPGGSAVAWHEDWLDPLSPLLERRHLILLDQRGTGYSTPSLACPEGAEVVEATIEADLDALRACHDRLTGEGIDLAAVSTPEIAADIADLRLAMGFDEWNVLSVSYGTRVALRLLDRDPEGLRSVVLDSVYPPDVVALESQAANAAAAITALLDACRAAPSCTDAVGDPTEALQRAVERLDAAPVEVTVGGVLGVGGATWEVDGAELVGALFMALYDTQLLPDVPAALAAAAEGDVEEALRLLGEVDVRARGSATGEVDLRARSSATEDSDGTFFSVECREEARTSSREETARQAASMPSPLGDILTADALGVYDVCDFWESGTAEPTERDPVVSDVPTLVLAGEFDPITPPAWGHHAAATLSASTVVEFPGVGHAVITQGECADDVVAAFLDRPEEPAEASCAASLPGVEFPS